jgi:hypothetical protein
VRLFCRASSVEGQLLGKGCLLFTTAAPA